MLKIDACGLSCPQPIIMLKRELEKTKEVILCVDNKTSMETCTRYALSRGYSVETALNGDIYELTVKKGA